MNDNLIGTITSFKIMGIKPNFSVLAKQTGKDRHTIAKMFKQKDGIIEHKKKGSVFDKYIEDIEPMLKTGCVSIKSTLWYINTTYGTQYKYYEFKKYFQTNKLKTHRRI